MKNFASVKTCLRLLFHSFSFTIVQHREHRTKNLFSLCKKKYGLARSNKQTLQHYNTSAVTSPPSPPGPALATEATYARAAAALPANDRSALLLALYMREYSCVLCLHYSLQPEHPTAGHPLRAEIEPAIAGV